jgi:hypothetical protein
VPGIGARYELVDSVTQLHRGTVEVRSRSTEPAQVQLTYCRIVDVNFWRRITDHAQLHSDVPVGLVLKTASPEAVIENQPHLSLNQIPDGVS